MKRSVEALVLTLAVTVAAALLLAPAASAVSPVVQLKGDAWLTKMANGSTQSPATFHVDASFATDTPGADLFTIQKAVIWFPDHSGTNGSLFPSCGPQQIERFHGDLRRCPKGSQIGRGTVKAQALQLGVTATGQVAMFNSRHGKSITFNIRTYTPAYINESIEAPITQLHGRYGEKLTLVVPHSLQEIISGVFAGIQDFTVTTTGSVRVHGVEYSYLKARTCPTSPLHAAFDFKDWASGQTATTAIDTRVHCSIR